MPVSIVTNEDCMDMMKRYEDKFFDLAIVDPPYGIGETGERSTRPHKTKKCKNPMGAIKNYKIKDWDNAPPNEDYFKELFRVSKNQIIWGANHFISKMPIDSSGWIVWDKLTGDNDFSDCELAWTSFDRGIRKIELLWNGFQKCEQVNRIHPTQKPIKLYRWTLGKYTMGGEKILDTHLGSGSHRIAAYKLNFDFWGCEADEDHFNDQEKRFKQAINEPLFQTIPEPEQTRLF